MKPVLLGNVVGIERDRFEPSFALGGMNPAPGHKQGPERVLEWEGTKRIALGAALGQAKKEVFAWRPGGGGGGR